MVDVGRPLGRRRGDKLASFHREPLTFRYVAGKLSVALLVLGIAGELVAGREVAELSGKEIAAAKLEAANANERAGKPDERAAQAVERAAALGVSLNDLRDFVQERQREADRLKGEIAAREVTLRDALREADALVAAIGARQRAIEEASSPRFVDQMRPVARLRVLATPPVFVTAGSGGEPSELADETGHMFRFAGGKVAALADDGRNHREGVRLEYFLGETGRKRALRRTCWRAPLARSFRRKKWRCR